MTKAAACFMICLSAFYFMSTCLLSSNLCIHESQSTLEHEDKQCSTFREVAELRSGLAQRGNDNGVTRNRLDLGSGHFGPFFPGRGVKK